MPQEENICLGCQITTNALIVEYGLPYCLECDKKIKECILPTYKGYTVDYRLREFRKITEDDFEIVSFDDELGDQLLVEMLEQQLVPEDKKSRIISRY